MSISRQAVFRRTAAQRPLAAGSSGRWDSWPYSALEPWMRLRNLLFLVEPMTARVLLPWEAPEFLGRERPPWGREPRVKLCWISRELPSALYCCPITMMFLGSWRGVTCLAPTTVRLLQDVSGSPVYPWGQEQMGRWSCTLQSAEVPQVPMQGSRQLKSKQASWWSQSWSYSHSPFWQKTKGSPWWPAGHLQLALSPLGMHWALVPQGLGLQGSGFSLQPEMVSGMGTKPGRHLQTGLPPLFTSQRVFGPQGEGSQGSGGGVRTSILEQPVMVSGAG